MTKKLFRVILAVSAVIILALSAITTVTLYRYTLEADEISLWGLIFNIFVPAVLIFSIAAAAIYFISSRLSKSIVKPLNEIDISEELPEDIYGELSPMLRRIEQQRQQLKRQARDLRHRREEFSAVTGSMNEGLVLFNNQGIILSINRAAAELLRADAHSLGRGISSLYCGEQMEETVSLALQGKKAEKSLTIGEGIYQLDASPIYSKDKISGAVMLLFDVTEKQLAEQLRREFSANVSHELKTPLHSISGYAELMAGGLVSREDIPDFAKKIHSEALRMINLVEDIIRLSRLDEGNADAPSPINLYYFAEEALRSLEQEAKQREIALSLSGEGAIISAVPTQISAIIFNLCDNAIKYNKIGGSVTVTVERENDSAVITVSDTGIGISAADQPRIFERFYRVDKSHSKHLGGTGLGLSIVKHAVRSNGGEISLQSALGEGTKIKVSFPACDNM